MEPWFAGLMDTGPHDRMYDCLPLYHSVGGVVATGALLVRGGSVVIREKFSAQRFLERCRRRRLHAVPVYRRTCRYLVNAPPHPLEREHRLRMCCGNGLRADIWEKFRQRFAIPRILEFYASTEGNFSLYNVEGRVGAIGRVPPFLAHRFPLALVKFDAVSRRAGARAGRVLHAMRDRRNRRSDRPDRARASSPRAAGSRATPTPQDTEKKILRNVFEPAMPGTAPAI